MRGEPAVHVPLERDGTTLVLYGPGKAIYMPPGRPPLFINERTMRKLAVAYLQYEQDRRGADAIAALLRSLEAETP